MDTHWVFITQYRGLRGEDSARPTRGVCRRVFRLRVQLVELDAGDERVYLRVNYPRKIAVAGIVNSLEGVSGRLSWR